MPFIKIKTNTAAAAAQKEQIKTQLGAAIPAIPGKSERWLMVGIEDSYPLWFQGSDAPAAIAEVSIYGKASETALNDLTGRITSILADVLAVSPDRVYVSYLCTPYWGWNGANF